MRSNNPAFSRNEAFTRGGYATFDVQTPSADQLEDQYSMPSPVRERAMTLEDVVTRTGIMFAVLLATAVPTFWGLVTGAIGLGTGFLLTFGGMIAGLVLGLVISFSKKVRPGLIVTYAAIEGLFVGGISAIYTLRFGDGLVGQAVLGTLVAFGAMLVAYQTGLIRATGRFRKILIIATMGYLALGLINLVSVFVFNQPSIWFDTGILGIGLSLLGVTLASLFLVLDFDFVEQGIRNQLPQRYAWSAAFGLVVTLIWLYLEILRLLAILRGSE
ncbi:Bax inhibitor-1/YccA family protein [Aquipuribacter nitratireducens]|uniref:Bax inhibitor-1/YccA family protein n=1 Tax=Aquipuribacter nitratireducens TaxID=650104 RepID=A0ABW0GHY6_9MICO